MEKRPYQEERFEYPEEYKNYLEVNLLTGFESLPLTYDEYVFVLAFLQDKK